MAGYWWCEQSHPLKVGGSDLTKAFSLRMIDRAPVAGKCMKTRIKTVMSSCLIRVEQEQCFLAKFLN